MVERGDQFAEFGGSPYESGGCARHAYIFARRTDTSQLLIP
jgi:hypothetical protein